MSDSREVEFPKGEPEHWYAEYDVKEKVLEVCLGEYAIRIPQETVMHWFMQEEYNALRSEGKLGSEDEEDESDG